LRGIAASAALWAPADPATGVVVVVTAVVVVVEVAEVVVVTDVVVVVLGTVVVVTAVVVVVELGGTVEGVVVVVLDVGGTVEGVVVVVVVLGAVVDVVVVGAAVVVVTEVVAVVGKADVGGAVVGVEVVLGHPGPLPWGQGELDVLVGDAVVVVGAQGLAPAAPVQELVDVLTAGREVFVVVLDVLVGTVVLVVVDVFVVADVLVVAAVVVVGFGPRFVVLVVLLVVVVVVLVVVDAGTAGALVDAVAGSPRYTQDTSTVGAWQPTGQANFTGKSATATCGTLTAQPFLAALAETRQSVPAGSPVPW
jgi:hypothetical protein